MKKNNQRNMLIPTNNNKQTGKNPNLHNLIRNVNLKNLQPLKNTITNNRNLKIIKFLS